jgi:adenine-specific DNA-methyltransferase
MADLNGSVGARDYIAWGEEEKINEGYKFRIRDEWQIVPSQRISEALFIRRNNKTQN